MYNRSHSHLDRAKLTPKEPGAHSNELHVRVEHISKLYMDNTGSFPIISLSGNQYLIIACHCDSNAILVSSFKSQKDLYRLLAYNYIMAWIKNCDQLVDLQILDNKASEEYKRIMKDIWNVE